MIDEGRLRIFPAGSVSDRHVIDLDGLAVTPGFIDSHSHADLEAISFQDNPQVHSSRLLQGVTTEVVGNCGFSPFPVPVESSEHCERLLGMIMGPDAATFPDWRSYVAGITDSGPASNIAPLVGHGTLRAATLGFQARPATESELERMVGAFRTAMAEGAFGLSSGLCYTPATFAGPEELRSLVQVLAEAGGIYSTHVRNETDLAKESIAEAMNAVRGLKVPLHISHLKIAGSSYWGASAEILDQLDEARSEGLDVTADVYPYTAASTMLQALLPPWLAEGGVEELLRRMADPSVRERAARDLADGIPGWQNLGQAAGWDRVVVASAPGRTDWEGSAIPELSIAEDSNVVDTIGRLLIETRARVIAVIHSMDENDVVRFLGWPYSVVGSDGIPLPGKPHPRLTGTFPRALSRYSAAFGSFEDAVHRMSEATAVRFAVPQRGSIRDGLVADLVVLDPDLVSDRSTYDEPWLPPAGIHHVILGGQFSVWNGEVVDARAGVVLQRAGV